MRIEHITHSICTLEFEDHRPLYDWFIENLPVPSRPRQYEFARLNMTYTVLSKRVLTELVRGGHVSGWDDPRMPTIAGLRRRGVPPAAIRDFVKRIGVAKANSVVDAGMFEFTVREALNKGALRRMAVLRPLKVVIENYPEGKTEELEAVNNPEDASAGARKIRFSRELWVERDDFMENPPKKFFRLSPGKEVRLRYAYFVTCREAVKDAKGEVVELRCTYDPATKGGNTPPDGRKVQATLHWVSAADAVPAEVRLYNQLFAKPDPDVANFAADLNPNSLEVVAGAMLEPAAAADNAGEPVQFERQGYFCRDVELQARAPGVQPHGGPARHLGQGAGGRRRSQEGVGCLTRRGGRRRLLDPGEQLVVGRRPVHRVALRVVASPLAQQGERRIVLHTLGDALEVERPGEPQDRAHDLLVVGVVGELLHECLIDLERGYGELLEVGERGVAGAEIVDRHAIAAVAQAGDKRGAVLEVVHHGAFGDLELDLLGVDAVAANGLVQGVEQEAAVQVAHRQVDGDAEGMSAGRPGGLVGERGVDDPLGDVVDQRRLLGLRDEVAGRDQAALRMRPSQQRFRARGPAGGERELGLMPDHELVVGDRGRDHAEQHEVLAAREVAGAVVEMERTLARDGRVHGDAGLLQQLLDRAGVLGVLGGAEREIDVQGHLVDQVGSANLRLDVGPQLAGLRTVVEDEGEAVALDERDRHVGRHQRPPALADLLEELLAEGGAERVLDVEQVLDLHDDEEDLRFVSAALDTLPQLPEEAGAVEHARAPIVLVEPVEEVELPAQGARAEAD